MAINWNQSLSTTSSVFETGANIYAAIQAGEIKAIQAEMKAKQLQFQSDMADFDKRSKIDQINLAYEEQTAQLSEELQGAQMNQMMTAVIQGRSFDSLESARSTDDRQYLRDQEKSALNKDYQVNQAEADANLQKSMTASDINSLKTAAGQYKAEAGINAAQAGLKGAVRLENTNAFDTDSYSDGASSDNGSSSKVKETYNTKYQKKLNNMMRGW